MNNVKQMFPALCCECRNPAFYIIGPMYSLEIPLHQTVLMNGETPVNGDTISKCPSCASTFGCDVPNIFDLLEI